MVKTDKILKEDIEELRKKFPKIEEFQSTQETINSNYSESIEKLEREVEELKKRPVVSGGADVDYSILCMKEEYLELVARMDLTEKRNIE